MMLKRAAIVAVTLAPTLYSVAWAQVSPDRAAILQRQLQDWWPGILGDPATPGGVPPRVPVRVTAAGDHFDIAVPLGANADAPVLSGRMTDAGSGRWAVDDVSIPSPSVFRHRLPPAKTPGAPEGEVTSTMTLGSQQQHLLLDPTFATPSTSASTFKDLSIATAGANLSQLTHIDSGTGTAIMTPVADGRVDVAIDSAMDGYTLKMSPGAAGAPIAVAMGKVSIVANLAGVSRDRAIDIARHLSGKLPGTAPRGPGGKTLKAPPDAGKISALLAVLVDLANSGSLDEKLEDLAFTTPDVTGALKRLSIGLTSTAAAGKLQARMPLAAEGLTLPDIGLGGMAALIPTRLAFTPSVGAIPTDAMSRLVRKLAANRSPADDDVAALFIQGPITAGIEDLSLDLAGAGFTGGFDALVTSPGAFSGTGKITATGFDKLQQALAVNPRTAQFAPVLIFLKGIGRAEPDRLVWDLIYNDGRLLVNGQDMAALTGSPAGPARPGPARRAPNP